MSERFPVFKTQHDLYLEEIQKGKKLRKVNLDKPFIDGQHTTVESTYNYKRKRYICIISIINCHIINSNGYKSLQKNDDHTSLVRKCKYISVVKAEDNNH